MGYVDTLRARIAEMDTEMTRLRDERTAAEVEMAAARRAREEMLSELQLVNVLLMQARAERDRNAEIAEGLAERIHHELNDYGAYSSAMDELTSGDGEPAAALKDSETPQ